MGQRENNKNYKRAKQDLGSCCIVSIALEFMGSLFFQEFHVNYEEYARQYGIGASLLGVPAEGDAIAGYHNILVYLSLPLTNTKYD